MASKPKTVEELGFAYRPRGPAQVVANDVWRDTRVLFLIGPAGTGKTAAAMGMGLREILRMDRGKLTLARPMVTCDEDTGFLPGVLAQKLGPWMGPFHDVFGTLSTADWAVLERKLNDRLEPIPVGMLRGRTIRNGVLICDEIQNCTYSQLKCILTRIGEGGRIVLCGDPEQSDRFSAKNSPLLKIQEALRGVVGVNTVKFCGVADQLREPLVTEILSRV